MSSIVNATNRFYANGQNFINSLLQEGMISKDTTVTELLKLAKDKQKEYPRDDMTKGRWKSNAPNKH